MSLRALWLALAFTGLVGCVKAPFTTDVLERYGLTPRDLSRIQFFTSETIVLQREVSSSTRVQTDGELSFRDDMRTEVVSVSEHTPCVALRVEGDYLLLGFSPKDVRAALWFRAEPLDGASSSVNGRRYSLVALENEYHEASEVFAPRWSKGFLVSWSGHKYHVVSGRDAYLLYELSDDSERDEIERSPPGWRLSERGPRRSIADPQPSAAAPAAAPSATTDPPSIEVEP